MPEQPLSAPEDDPGSDTARAFSRRIRTPGLILGTERFAACVAFYRDLLGLPVWFEKEGLVCLRIGDGYLMVETGGVAAGRRKPTSQNPTVLRFNVNDVDREAAWLRDRGVEVEVLRFDWGIVGLFEDPDGNPCELKDAGDADFSGAAPTAARPEPQPASS